VFENGVLKRILGTTTEKLGEIGRARSRRAYKILVGRPRRIWEDNIKTDLKEITELTAQDRDLCWAFVNVELLGSIIFLEFL
jgi:hypothetical protein